MTDDTLSTARLRLVPVDPGLAGAVTEYNRTNHVHLQPWNPLATPDTFREEAVRASIVRNADERSAGRRYDYAIFLSDDPAVMIGQIALSNVVRGVLQACYAGYGLAANAQGNGYMTEALRAAIQFGFERLRLHRIMATYMPRNERSAAVLKRLGFVIEGTAKDYLFIAGRWEDSVLTSLTNPDFTW